MRYRNGLIQLIMMLAGRGLAASLTLLVGAEADHSDQVEPGWAHVGSEFFNNLENSLEDWRDGHRPSPKLTLGDSTATDTLVLRADPVLKPSRVC
jgi:hypothetical protein